MEFKSEWKCNMILPLLFLILIDLIAFFHIANDIIIIHLSTHTQLVIFTISLILTCYYINKRSCEIIDCFRKIKRWCKNVNS